MSPARGPRVPHSGQTADVRLDSWKEIAAYLHRGVRTVRRWEKEEGLPVRRHKHSRLGSVYAYKPEVDAWWDARDAGQDPPAARVEARSGDQPGVDRKSGDARTWQLAALALAGFTAGFL